MADAFVLAGSVAKGAFGAGVIAGLVAPGAARALALDVRRVVGVSSGALNAVYLAYAAHAGIVTGAGEVLERLWRDASLPRVFDPSLRAILGGRGISGEEKVLAMMRGAITATPAVHPVDFRVVVTNPAGDVQRIGDHHATTFEHVLRFDNHAFADASRLDPMFRAVAASAAFPVVFVPVPLTIEHRTVQAFDGGAVNNTPLRHALENGPEIDRVFVVSPFPRAFTETPPMRGLAFLSHLADILIEERLFRDLREAEKQNRVLTRLAALPLDAHQRHAVLGALGWQRQRPVTIIEVRPERSLEGDAFRGFFSRRLRAQYIEAGRQAAARVVAAHEAREPR